MKYGTLALLVCFSALLVTVIAGIADDKYPTEAPSGFTTPSFDGQNSVSNGVPEPAVEAVDDNTLLAIATQQTAVLTRAVVRRN